MCMQTSGRLSPPSIRQRCEMPAHTNQHLSSSFSAQQSVPHQVLGSTAADMMSQALEQQLVASRPGREHNYFSIASCTCHLLLALTTTCIAVVITKMIA